MIKKVLIVFTLLYLIGCTKKKEKKDNLSVDFFSKPTNVENLKKI